MQTITARNVNDAFPIGIMYLRNQGVVRQSRNGPVLELNTPLSIEYRNPMERVLFDKKRAINPFLHFFEPLWILAGRDDVGFLADIVSRFKEYSDDGKRFYGAYGVRLHAYEQLYRGVEQLKKDPTDRRVVLLIRCTSDIIYEGKDQPCNIAITCKIRDGALHICVYNRSNDYLWGMTGANMPQFSVLQEYMAGMIGVKVGTYHQITDSAHVYINNPQWDTLKYTPPNVCDPYIEPDLTTDSYPSVVPYPMFKGIEDKQHIFNEDLKEFFRAYDSGFEDEPVFISPFFNEVVMSMWNTFTMHKRHKGGLRHVDTVQARDWHKYTKQWLIEREVKLK